MAQGFDVSEFDKFTKDMIDMAEKKMPKKLNRFINRESTKLTSRTKKEAKIAIENVTGKYHGSIERIRNNKKGSRSYIGGTVSADRKAHLLELGHEQVIGRGPRKGTKVGVVAGRNVFKAAADSFEDEFNRDLSEFVDDVAKELTK